jgi:DNA-binding protein HU-beta
LVIWHNINSQISNYQLQITNNKHMNKAKLIERIAAEAAVTKKQAEDMLDGLVEIIISELKVGNEVTITGFGTFLARTRHARGGVNPQKPSERIQIPEVKVAKFKTGKTLKDALKGKI